MHELVVLPDREGRRASGHQGLPRVEGDAVPDEIVHDHLAGVYRELRHCSSVQGSAVLSPAILSNGRTLIPG